MFEFIIILATIFLFFQGLFFSVAMLYAWKDPNTQIQITPPKMIFGIPRRKFSILIPVRFEEKVIRQTLLAFSQIAFPKNQYEVIVIAREDDVSTINEITKTLKDIPQTNVKLVMDYGYPINKPKSLNTGLKEASFPYIGVFDAEDQPKKNLLVAIDSFLDHHPEADVIQSGIQLTNVNSSWFAPLACLEYYFWFRSVLPLFTTLGSTPLGGNTVFFRKSAIQEVGGWDETCLTEDAEIGTRMAASGYNLRAIYESALTTLEETPTAANAFIKQRTRWIQGYLQTIGKGYWAKQNTWQKRILSLYLLLQPVVHELLTFLFVALPILAISVKVSLFLTMASFLPLYFLILQIGLATIGLQNLNKTLGLKFSLLNHVQIIIFYFPYQLLISLAFIRAVFRQLSKNIVWEKTEHYEKTYRPIFNPS